MAKFQDSLLFQVANKSLHPNKNLNETQIYKISVLSISLPFAAALDKEQWNSLKTTLFQ